MSLHDGWAALHLEMPPRVPRTEYSAEFHWDLVNAVTGGNAFESSEPEVREQASEAFVKAWNYDLVWNTLIAADDFGPWRTRMGQGIYRADGADWDDRVSSPFCSPEEVLRFDPLDALPHPKRRELIDRFEADYKEQQRRFPEALAMTGVYVTCISGLIDLFGWDLMLTACGEDPEAFGEMALRYGKWLEPYVEALSEADVPVVMLHDDMVWTSGAIFPPCWYREFVFPSIKKLVRPLRDEGKRVLFTADGNYTEFIADLVACGLHGFVMEPATNLAYAAEEFGRTHVLVGNADTRILLRNDRDAIRREVERCMAIGKGCPGYFMAVGNHIPPNTPVEAALYYNEVYEELSRR
ncbi:MAG TPA: uroporphyrinogen decarboxylase family protein [Fimbriimonas sp.]